MNHSVKIINRTVECENEDPYKLREDMCIIAGKAAGICYMDDNYLSEGIMDTEKALKRANMTAKSGHYSTYEHGHISFLIETSKIMAMVLNSLNLYSTSEKSGRYTTFTGESELEISMYNKWKSKFTRLIDICYSGRYTEKEVEKLSIENARYMIDNISMKR